MADETDPARGAVVKKNVGGGVRISLVGDEVGGIADEDDKSAVGADRGVIGISVTNKVRSQGRVADESGNSRGSISKEDLAGELLPGAGKGYVAAVRALGRLGARTRGSQTRIAHTDERVRVRDFAIQENIILIVQVLDPAY